MEKIDFEKVKTTKDKDAILSRNFVYNFKCENKDSSQHFVCNHGGCYSSLTVLNGSIIKVNGKKCEDNTELVHAKHGPYKTEDIIGMNFKKTCKARIDEESMFF